MTSSATLELVSGLVVTQERWSQAERLARYAGADHLIILIPDPELNQHLPAQGFPQTLPGGRRWREFVCNCLLIECHTGELLFPDGSSTCSAMGFAARDGSVAVLLGGNPSAGIAQELRQLLPLLGAAYRQEAQAQVATARATLAEAAAAQASSLAEALDSVRRELQHAISYRDLALQAAQMGTWRWEAKEKRAIWSDVQERLFGLKPGTYDGTGQMFFSLVHSDDRAKVRGAVADELREHQGYRITYRVIWPDGQVRWLAAHGHSTTSEDGTVTGLTGVTWDITEHKQAEDALVQQAHELARSNADLQQFAYVTSHDLQEPIRTVVSYGQLLLKRYEETLDADARRFLTYVVESGTRMADLVQDLLSFSRVSGTRDIPRRPVSLEDSLQWSLMNLQQAISAANAEVTHDPLPVVHGNKIQLVQLLQNLIGNAIKYRSGKPPAIHISASADEIFWTISVRDNGIGIDPGYRERIFEIFKRLHGREIPGTGIGLAICKKIVETHGGRIWVEGDEGGGSRFVFTLRRE